MQLNQGQSRACPQGETVWKTNAITPLLFAMLWEVVRKSHAKKTKSLETIMHLDLSHPQLFGTPPACTELGSQIPNAH